MAPFIQNEPIDELRTIPIMLVDAGGGGVAGQVGLVTIKIAKIAGNWLAPGGGAAFTEVTGGPSGTYRLKFDVGDWDTAGLLYYSVTRPGVVKDVVDAITIEPLTRYALHYGKAPAGSTAGTLKLAADASAADGFYADGDKACIATIVSGNGKGQARHATGYTALGKVLAVAPNWDAGAIPDNTSVYRLDPITDQLAANVIATIQAGTASAAAVAAIPTNPLRTNDARLDNLDAKVSSRLAPSVAGRSLAVAVGGQAGIDWANVANAAAVLALANTTISGGGGGGGGGDPATIAAAVGNLVTDPSAPAGAQTVAQVLNILLAYVAGELSGLPPQLSEVLAYLSAGGNKQRIGGTVNNGQRTISQLDGTP